MAELAEVFAGRINRFAIEMQLNVHCAAYKGIFTVFFTKHSPLRSLEDVKRCDTEMFAAFFRHMLKRGFYLSPSQFELNFISAAHTKMEINAAADAAIEFLGDVRSNSSQH